MQPGNPILDLKSKKATHRRPGRARRPTRPTSAGSADDKVVDPAAIGWKNAQADRGVRRRQGRVPADGVALVAGDASTSRRWPATTRTRVMPTIPPGRAELPAGGKAAASIISGDNMVVAKYSKNQDLALRADQDAHQHREPGRRTRRRSATCRPTPTPPSRSSRATTCIAPDPRRRHQVGRHAVHRRAGATPSSPW